MSPDDYELKPNDEPPKPAAPNAAPAKTGRAGSNSEPPSDTEGWVTPEELATQTKLVQTEKDDIDNHKGMALLGYICFLIPLLTAPNSKFARFHANQGLLLFIALMVVVVTVSLLQGAVIVAALLLSKIAILDYFFAGIFHLLQFALLVTWLGLMIYGILQAAAGESQRLPGIGHWSLIK